MELDLSSTLIGDKPWQRRASPLARFALAVYIVIAVYAGLAPWSGWRDLGLSPFAYLWSPVPRHLTVFDLAVNVLAYLPLGALAVLALHPRVRGVAALAAATLLGLLLAGGIEALQTYLPRRVAQWRARGFSRDASALLVLLALWPAAQVWPGPLLFGNGQLFDAADLLTHRWGLLTPAELATAWGPSEFVLSEALVVAAGTLAAGLALACVVQARTARLPLLLAFVALALAAKAFSYALSFGPERAFVWLTPGAFGGLVLGLLALSIAALGPPRALLAGSLAATVAWLAAVNLVPDNPYHAQWFAGWRPGRLAHFHALAQWIALAWPWLLLVLLGLLALGRRRLR